MKGKSVKTVILTLCLSSVFLVFLVTRLSFGGRHGKIHPATLSDRTDHETILNEVGIPVQNKISVSHASMVCGKDATLYLKIQIPEEFMAESLQSLESVTYEIEPSDLTVIQHKGIYWFHINTTNAVISRKAMLGFSEITVMHSVDGFHSVFVCTDGGSDGISASLWRIFTNQ